MALRGLLLLSAVGLASGEAVNLTPDNFDAEVKNSGKAAFIKFLAPWCGHCKKMKPDWDALGKEYEGSTKVVIGDVDCTAAGKPLCDKYGVKGYPTIKFFNPPDEEGEDYKGGRDLAALKKFAANELGPGCSADTLDNCSDEQKAELKTYIDMDATERATKLEALKTAMSEAQTAHEALLKSLQSQYKESQENLDKLKDESAPTIKLLKAATPKEAAAKETTKDEV